MVYSRALLEAFFEISARGWGGRPEQRIAIDQLTGRGLTTYRS